jgi:hypothetical protein
MEKEMESFGDPLAKFQLRVKRTAVTTDVIEAPLR